MKYSAPPKVIVPAVSALPNLKTPVPATKLVPILPPMVIDPVLVAPVLFISKLVRAPPTPIFPVISVVPLPEKISRA